MNVQDLSLQDLSAVTAVATAGHFGRAAAALGRAQPTLSAQVSKVEKALGARLFERSARRFIVTADGQRLLPLIREVLESSRRLEGSCDAAGGRRPPLRLGVIPTLGPYLMPHLLGPLTKKGEPPFLVSEQPTAALTEAVLDGTLDAALLSLPVRNESIESLGLFEEAFHLIALRGSAIVELERLVPSRLSACEMVLLEDGHCLREQAVAVCGRRGGTMPRMVTTSLETLKYLVAAQNGYSLLPALACELPAGLGELVRIRKFDERTPLRRIGLCFRQSTTRRAALVELARAIRGSVPGTVRVIAEAKLGR